MDRSFIAVEDTLINAVLYNYTSTNTNREGDGWNGEDLSLYCEEGGGGRALCSAVRPYPIAVAGRLLHMRFHAGKRELVLSIAHEEGIQAPTEIFVPALQYPRGYRVEASDGEWEQREGGSILVWRHTAGRREHRIRIFPAP